MNATTPGSSASRILAREHLRCALMVPQGEGWRVGVGRVVTGRLDAGDGPLLKDEAAAVRATIVLEDELDLLAVRVAPHKPDPWTADLRERLSAAPAIDQLTTDEALQLMGLPGDERGKASAMRVAAALVDLGFVRRKVRARAADGRAGAPRWTYSRCS